MPQNTRTPRVESILASYAASLLHCESETTCLRATVPATTLCTHSFAFSHVCVCVCGSRSTDIRRFSATAHSAHSFAAHPFWRWFVVSPPIGCKMVVKTSWGKGFVFCVELFTVLYVASRERGRKEGRQCCSWFGVRLECCIGKRKNNDLKKSHKTTSTSTLTRQKKVSPSPPFHFGHNTGSNQFPPWIIICALAGRRVTQSRKSRARIN